MRLLAITCACCAALLAMPVVAGPLVEISAEASKAVPNDMMRATVYVELTGDSPKDVAKRVNAAITEALAIAKPFSQVKTRTSAANTYPVYGKSRKIEGWRMRSEIAAESRDSAALSELLGRLQQTMAIGQFAATVSPEAYKAVEGDVIVDAIGEFKARAQRVAGTLGKGYSIKELHVSANRGGMPHPMPRMMTMAAAEAAPMPIEAGESSVVVNITGKIEIAE